MKRAVYEKQFKMAAVKLAGAGALSVAEVAKELGISMTCPRIMYIALELEKMIK